MTLRDITEVAVDNADCVILKVLPGHEFDLISLGCFDGDETMFRLTKGDDCTCTVFRKDRKPYSWHWGRSGFTLVTDSLKRKRPLLIKALTAHGVTGVTPY